MRKIRPKLPRPKLPKIAFSLPKVSLKRAPPFFAFSRGRLVEEKKDLEKQLKQINQTDPAEVGGRVLDAEAGDESEEATRMSRAAALRSIILDKLSDIKLALHKGRSGSYGVCDRCGKKIDPARLKAVPEAHYCLDCERELEMKDGDSFRKP